MYFFIHAKIASFIYAVCWIECRPLMDVEKREKGIVKRYMYTHSQTRALLWGEKVNIMHFDEGGLLRLRVKSINADGVR